jgi:hypothetical protein
MFFKKGLRGSSTGISWMQGGQQLARKLTSTTSAIVIQVMGIPARVLKGQYR